MYRNLNTRPRTERQYARTKQKDEKEKGAGVSFGFAIKLEQLTTPILPSTNAPAILF